MVFLKLWFGILRSSCVLSENKNLFWAHEDVPFCRERNCCLSAEKRWRHGAILPLVFVQLQRGRLLLERFHFLLKTLSEDNRLSYAFLLESHRPACWCGRSFQNSYCSLRGRCLRSAGEEQVECRAEGLQKWLLSPDLLPVDSRILKKNKEAAVISAGGDRGKDFPN